MGCFFAFSRASISFSFASDLAMFASAAFVARLTAGLPHSFAIRSVRLWVFGLSGGSMSADLVDRHCHPSAAAGVAWKRQSAWRGWTVRTSLSCGYAGLEQCDRPSTSWPRLPVETPLAPHSRRCIIVTDRVKTRLRLRLLEISDRAEAQAGTNDSKQAGTGQRVCLLPLRHGVFTRSGQIMQQPSFS